MPKVAVPITPDVFRWAISESGYTPEEVAHEAKLDPAHVADWLEARSQPGVSDVRALAHVLRRPVAALLLPKPPVSKQPAVALRRLPGVPDRPLTPVERRYVRKATRLQTMLAGVAAELGESPTFLPTVERQADMDVVAAQVRRTLGLPLDAHTNWTSASAAFDAWREAVESTNVAVFLFQMGPDNCRGFSLWNDRVPVVAVNTAWNDEARTFTLLHELGHLVTHTNSACAVGAPATVTGSWDPVERWCEEFAAALLLPEQPLRTVLVEKLGPQARATEVGHVSPIARRFRASLRATTIRLIQLNLANWDLYRALPEATDAKRGGGGAKGGRDRQEIQEDSLGRRTTDLVSRGMAADLVSRSEALSYLDVPDPALDTLAARSA
jgi:Zn-dependent peptidase ImmA (M78 family)